ncbi:hypothetical protein [Streptomyces sp. AN091965]|uniref:hypothetical protein n=1 Tax=Streptomyces sp. AN091965 TaxID=2927803 RepID=UPI001F6127DB|nr:hypothetical protein [Streptomyces sp. AN091965]MCI3928317.1 hypothetical protein [Streptomyces sp. AN091965]
MTERRNETPGESEQPIPRDLPDQQAGAGSDPLEDDRDQVDREDVPSPDEPGARRSGEERSDTVHPEHPDPEEPTD